MEQFYADLSVSIMFDLVQFLSADQQLLHDFSKFSMTQQSVWNLSSYSFSRALSRILCSVSVFFNLILSVLLPSLCSLTYFLHRVTLSFPWKSQVCDAIPCHLRSSRTLRRSQWMMMRNMLFFATLRLTVRTPIQRVLVHWSLQNSMDVSSSVNYLSREAVKSCWVTISSPPINEGIVQSDCRCVSVLKIRNKKIQLRKDEAISNQDHGGPRDEKGKDGKISDHGEWRTVQNPVYLSNAQTPFYSLAEQHVRHPRKTMPMIHPASRELHLQEDGRRRLQDAHHAWALRPVNQRQYKHLIALLERKLFNCQLIFMASLIVHHLVSSSFVHCNLDVHHLLISPVCQQQKEEKDVSNEPCHQVKNPCHKNQRIVCVLDGYNYGAHPSVLIPIFDLLKATISTFGVDQRATKLCMRYIPLKKLMIPRSAKSHMVMSSSEAVLSRPWKDNDNDTPREVRHRSNEGLDLQARV